MSISSQPDMTESMSRLTIHLLGSPTVERSTGLKIQPRGNKVWGLLAFLALTATAQPRHLLAGMMFPDADDPLGALRWNVSQLRRLLGADASVGVTRSGSNCRPG
ncbi:MAG: AfsR/SARP family transcriptional regulator [Acidimicrobiia bacterium]